MLRLNEVDAHCAAVLGLVPPNPNFLEETLRGFVLHLSAHFQGFCRDLYTECSQIWIAVIPAGLQATAQAQFSAHLALEKGNPSYDNIRRDFNRFGFLLNLQAAHAVGPQRVTDLGHLNDWRNKAAHQGTQPLGRGSAGNSDTSHPARMEDVLRWTGCLARRYHARRIAPYHGGAAVVKPVQKESPMATQNLVEPLKIG